MAALRDDPAAGARVPLVFSPVFGPGGDFHKFFTSGWHSSPVFVIIMFKCFTKHSLCESRRRSGRSI